MKWIAVLFAISLTVSLPAAVSAAESVEELIEYAKQPIIVRKTVEEQRTVYVPHVKQVRTIERYGLFKRKCRIVTRTVTEMVPETRTSTKEVQELVESVAAGSSTKSSTKVVKLDAPLSAGAIAQRVIEQMGLAFPAADFPLTADADNQFPVNLTSTADASDGFRYQFLIDPQSNPNFVDVVVFAKDTNGGDPQAKADARLTETETALTTK